MTNQPKQWTKQTLQSFLNNATISPAIFTLRPDYKTLLIAASNIPPAGPSNPHTTALLTKSEQKANSLLQTKPITELPHISSWRNTYKSFGAPPKKYRNSLESLTRRVSTGLPHINALTDIYNSISVTHQIPLGGEDLDRYDGSPRLFIANGDEEFNTTAAGTEIVEHPDVGEVVWGDSRGVTCRRWNWRQCRRTALREETTSVLFILDKLDPVSDRELVEAGDELEREVAKLGGDVIFARRLIEASSS